MPVLVGANPSKDPLVLDRLRQHLAKELGPNIGVACRNTYGDPEELWPVEREAILNAIPRRQREFAAGRSAAREAMTQVGWPPEAIPCASDRSPMWPEGLVGSIAHTGSACVAIASRRNHVPALGIDIEEDVALAPDLWETICTPGELAILASLPRSDQGRRVTKLFCAKEAFYKWQYPRTEHKLDFCDVQVTLSRGETRFCVHLAASDSPFLDSCQQEGSLLTFGGLVLAWLAGPTAINMGVTPVYADGEI
jgi:4'-phosphopantetheinyl transferase EntD